MIEFARDTLGVLAYAMFKVLIPYLASLGFNTHEMWTTRVIRNEYEEDGKIYLQKNRATRVLNLPGWSRFTLAHQMYEHELDYGWFGRR